MRETGWGNTSSCRRSCSHRILTYASSLPSLRAVSRRKGPSLQIRVCLLSARSSMGSRARLCRARRNLSARAQWRTQTFSSGSFEGKCRSAVTWLWQVFMIHSKCCTMERRTMALAMPWTACNCYSRKSRTETSIILGKASPAFTTAMYWTRTPASLSRTA